MKTRNKLLKYLDTSWEMLANNEKPPIIDLSEFNMFSFYIQIFTNRNERKSTIYWEVLFIRRIGRRYIW